MNRVACRLIFSLSFFFLLGHASVEPVIQNYNQSLVRILSVDHLGKILAAGHDQGQINIWDINTGMLLHSLQLDFFNSLAINNQANILAVGQDSNIRILNLKTGKTEKLIQPDAGPIRALRIDASGRYIYSLHEDSLKKWQILNRSLIKSTSITFKNFGPAAFSSDGKYLLAENFGEIIIWDINADKVRTKTIRDNILVNSLTYIDGEVMAITDYSKITKIKNNASFNAVNSSRFVIASNPQGDFFYTGNGDGTISIFSLDQNKELAKLYTNGKDSLAITKEGYYIGKGLMSKHIQFIDAEAEMYNYSAFSNLFNNQQQVAAALGGKSVAPIDSKQIQITLQHIKNKASQKIKLASVNDFIGPRIIITYPLSQDLKVVERISKITVTGQAKDLDGIRKVLINNKYAKLSKDGHFSLSIDLNPGNNNILVNAYDLLNNPTKTTINVYHENIVVSDSENGNYYALVIGNNKFKYIPDLLTAVNDAQKISDVLEERYGFETTTLLNATRSDILGSLNMFRKKLRKEDHFMLYYAGHGVYDKDASKAYWLPVDAKSDDDTNWIIVDTFTANIKRMNAKHILVVADSCYSGTLVRSVIMDMKNKEDRDIYLRKMRRKPSRTLMSSGGNEPVTDGGGMGHSVFALAILDALQQMKQKVFTMEELFYDQVKERVAGNSNQTPEYNVIRNSGHDGGDFVMRVIDK